MQASITYRLNNEVSTITCSANTSDLRRFLKEVHGLKGCRIEVVHCEGDNGLPFDLKNILS